MILRPSRRGEPRVTLVRPTVSADSYGDPVVSWAAPVRTVLHGAVVQDKTSVETGGDARQRLTTTRVVYVPGDVEAESTDRVEIDGETWRIDGHPFVSRGLGYGNVYTTFLLTRPTG